MSRDAPMASRVCRPGTPDSAPWVSTLGLHRMRCKRANARHASVSYTHLDVYKGQVRIVRLMKAG